MARETRRSGGGKGEQRPGEKRQAADYAGIVVQTVSLVQIRYNTDSDGTANRWRVLLDGREHLADDVAVIGTLESTVDWLPEKQVTKYHLTARDCTVEFVERTGGVARIVVTTAA